ncbi:DUF2807 domain-containing protein [Flavobacterium sp. RSP49]|uniref:head GIN domain-containing protein n=1 Tax=unclassified Flavobacterium TaxID=196869 RepID=UPI000F82D0E8|nr:head GIN domain-containing protein [Flavobacterium sp. RSP49]RTY89013.1 DUF2807 domain-containing protein [Flavobacterium sp. RSP15]RTZ03546.1 DUF2807 domain-containing protein [Flavobacterium sp. RSP49]
MVTSVSFESISQVSLAGSGDIISKSNIKSKSFSAQLNGSGDLHLNFEATDFKINLSGSGDIILKGLAENFDSSLNGSGDIDASGLKAKNVTSTISGSGDSKIYCTKSIYARVSGSGDIEYKGDPKKKILKWTARVIFQSLDFGCILL